MELNLSNTVEILGIIGFTAGIIKYTVIDPATAITLYARSEGAAIQAEVIQY